MAVYVPAVSWEKALGTCRIVRTEDKDGFTCYLIEVRVSSYKWQVSRRYKQFLELHEKMTKQFSVCKNLLPPKKLLGNRMESFIMERQKALEVYLQTLVHQFSLLPEPLALFLDFQKYEVRIITATLSEMLFSEGDAIICKAEPYEFTPLQLYAVTERLKLGDPTCYSSNPKQDIAHLVEFLTQLKHLKIVGSFRYFEASNIIPNNLSYDLSMFKFAETLEIFNCKLENNLVSVGVLRSRLKSIRVHRTLADLSDLLLCEILHWCPSTDCVQNWPFWNSVTYANFSHNTLTKIHPCIKLLPSVQYIDLSHNEIEVIENMESLSELAVLILSHNKIKDLESLHTRLGNIHHLNLASNKIKSLNGLSKLFSVSELVLENNLISLMSEVTHLSKLPCLETLSLQNNPVTFTVDYRPQVLLMFESLASEITLDGLKATEKEIDTVSVLQALKLARGEPVSEMKMHNHTLKETCTGADMSASNFSYPGTSSQDLNNAEANATRKMANNLYETSKFRQQVETLRKIGGSDWLRLLNEMHSTSSKISVEQDSESCSRKEGALNNTQSNSTYSLDNIAGHVTSQYPSPFTFSFEISYPEWLMFLDSTNEDFKHQLVTTYLPDIIRTNLGDISIAMLTDTKVFWVVLLEQSECTVYETPVCILMLKTEIVFLKLKNFKTNELPGQISYVSKHYPEFSFLRSVALSNICFVSLGPCNAYVELKVKGDNETENLTILMVNKDNANIFVTECQHLYDIKLSQKLNPFANNTLDVEKINADFLISNSSVAKQIIFGQRVCISKALHRCQHGILHYIFVTPSHVILVEERLHFPQIVGLDITVKPQFQVCAIANVHTNIKQIHLKDIDYETDYDFYSSEQKNGKCDSIHEDGNLNILYNCGSWLIMEFESNVLLYLNFFNLRQRNEFLNSFLGARSQR